MESSQDFQEMVWHAQLGVFNMKGEDTSLYNQYAYSFIYLQAGHILFTLKSEVLNGAMKSILKKRRKKMTDWPFVNTF
jgi:beta-lactamase regulating signal transducer with metallopeptidase domain